MKPASGEKRQMRMCHFLKAKAWSEYKGHNDAIIKGFLRNNFICISMIKVGSPYLTMIQVKII